MLESTLGLTTFKFVTDYLNDDEACSPASSRATRRSTTTRRATSATASGSCARPSATRPEQADTVRETLRELLPRVADSLKPPGERTAGELLGVTQDEIRAFALDGLTRRLKIIGVPIETVFG